MQRLKFIAVGVVISTSLLLAFILSSPPQHQSPQKGNMRVLTPAEIFRQQEALLPGWKGCHSLSMELRNNMDHGHLEVTSGQAAGPTVLTNLVLALLGEPLPPEPDWDHRTNERRSVRPDEKGAWCWVHKDHPGLYLLVYPGGVNESVRFQTLTTEPFPEAQVGEGKKLQHQAIQSFGLAIGTATVL